MSREIKFRVYSNRYKKYLDTSGEGICCEVHHLALKPDGKLYYANIGIDYPGTLSECPTLKWEEDYEDCVIEQYTGLKDKNGKEIYEGDIVKANYFESHYAALDVGKTKQITGHIQFGSGCFYISSMSDETPLFQSGGSNNVEVIGNIHENTELLGGEE